MNMNMEDILTPQELEDYNQYRDAIPLEDSEPEPGLQTIDDEEVELPVYWR